MSNTRTRRPQKTATSKPKPAAAPATVTVKLSEAMDALRAANRLSERRMACRTAMAFRRLIRELMGVYADMEAERAKLLDQYVKKNGKGEYISLDDGRFEYLDDEAENACEAAYKELMDTPVEVHAQVEAHLLEDIEVEPAFLVALGDLLVE